MMRLLTLILILVISSGCAELDEKLKQPTDEKNNLSGSQNNEAASLASRILSKLDQAIPVTSYPQIGEKGQFEESVIPALGVFLPREGAYENHFIFTKISLAPSSVEREDKNLLYYNTSKIAKDTSFDAGCASIPLNYHSALASIDSTELEKKIAAKENFELPLVDGEELDLTKIGLSNDDAIQSFLNDQKPSNHLEFRGLISLKTDRDLDVVDLNKKFFASSQELTMSSPETNFDYMIVDFYGDSRSKTPLIRCIAPKNSTATLDDSLQQVVLPVSKIQVMFVKSRIENSDRITEVQGFTSTF